MYYFIDDKSNSKNQAILRHNEYDRDICENCGAIKVIYKGLFNFKIMGKLLDYYFVSSTPVISERFLNVLREYGFTGYDVSETTPYHGTVKMVGDPIKEKYYRLKVTGRCGLMCDMSGEPFPYCRKCRYKVDSIGLVANGVSFNQDEYDGSDLFAFENMNNIPIVSEAVKDILIKSKLTNISFVPLTDFVYDEPITKETAIKWINEGETCDELIEAWLKYGVLTEQELNEQLNKNEN